MAAYAALVSVMHIIEQIQHHPRPPISLDENQVEPLIDNVTFLQNFLEDYSYRVHNDDLESRIANAAHVAEDVLESHIVDRILGGATSHGENINPDDLFYQDLQKVIQDMNLIKKEVMEIKENMGSVQNHIVRRSSKPEAAPLSRSTVMGFDHLLDELVDNCSFLQNFLEDYSYRVHNDDLESRIENAIDVAKDIIESISGATTNPYDLFYQDLQKVIQDMNLIKKEVMEIKENMGSVQNHIVGRSSKPEAAPLSQSTVMGFDDVLVELMDKLTRQPSSELQIIPIVGMGGMGKTTLAQKVYEHLLIVQHFDIRAWATISQEYSAREILLQLLPGQDHNDKSDESELVVMLYKTLWGRRYLIVMDDMWNIDAWEKVKLSFPIQNNGSGIIITSRISNIAMDLTGGHGLEMNFLNKDISWSLLCKIVFGEGGCPLKLDATGKEIARNCKGLPLSLVVIGGLLAKSNLTREYWQYIAENLNSIVNLENDANCLNLLYISYNHLPVHLKPCFLYFGVFPEDREIFASELIKLWVAEGFLKPISGKSLEEVAEEYLKELYDRNLILVSDWECNGKVFSFRIHDLLRDLCLKVAEKEKFLWVTGEHIYTYIPHGFRRIVLLDKVLKKEEFGIALQSATALQSASNARSLINIFEYGVSKLRNFRLLRLLKTEDFISVDAIFSQLVNLRLVNIINDSVEIHLPSPSLCPLWNLHTITIRDAETTLDIWKMPRLRHVNIDVLCLGSSTSAIHWQPQDNFVLENLQTLKTVFNFKCSKKMVKRIPNIKALEIYYRMKRFIGSIYGINNFVRLQKLEKLRCEFHSSIFVNRNDLLLDLTFPHSLKVLDLFGSCLHWEDISIKIGSLPLLQVLKLDVNSVIGPEWETVEGQFCSLKRLNLGWCDLECWKTDYSHFPCLEELVLRGLESLKEIPGTIGDIPTLKLMKIDFCGYSTVVSAKQIHDEQKDCGNEALHFQVRVRWEHEQLQSLASNNFIVQLFP